jgi:hypothetical protein
MLKLELYIYINFENDINPMKKYCTMIADSRWGGGVRLASYNVNRTVYKGIVIGQCLIYEMPC